MSGVNKLILIGYLGADPELKYLQNGDPVCNFDIATTETWMDKNNQKQERTEWTTIVVWGKYGETCAKYLKKGRQVYVEGRKQTRSWEKDGQKHYKSECIAKDVQFLGGGGKDGNDSGRSEGQQPSGTGSPGGAPDDIPF